MEGMRKAVFEGMSVAVGDHHVKHGTFDIDFNGQIKARFKNLDGELICIEAMDGWGNNISDKHFGKELVLE